MLVAAFFQFLVKFGILTSACFLYNVFRSIFFLVNVGRGVEVEVEMFWWGNKKRVFRLW